MVLLVVLFLVLAAGAYGVLTVRASFPQTTGTIDLDGLDAPVQVARDAWGIPQITAETAHDLFMAEGFVHAQDRFWEMDFRRHVTSGRLSELFGASQLGTDTFIRTLGWRRTAEAELPLLSPDTRAYLQAYADGVNAYLGQHSGAGISLEYAVLGLQTPGYKPEPWTPADSVAWLKAMAWDLRGNMDDEIARVQLATRLDDAQLNDFFAPYPYDHSPVIVSAQGTGPSAAARPPASAGDGEVAGVAARMTEISRLVEGLPAALGSGIGIGSNSFAVAGSRTVSGKPLLVNDPHLGPSMPGIWYQVGLHCANLGDACPFDVSGFSFSGVPGVVIGHNNRIAWGFTNLGPDVSDLYLEDVQGDTYRVGDEMLPLEVRTETIKVAGDDPVTIRIRSTGHGPLLSDVWDTLVSVGAEAPEPAGSQRPGTAAPNVALRWTALDPGRTMDALFLLDAAQNFDDFRTAARSFEVPSQNMLYADVDGHIGYQAPGKIPIRGAGDGNWPAPGWDPAYDWRGYIPFDELPWTLDPAAGYIVTANNAVIGPDYPYHLTDDWDRGQRAARLVDLVAAASPLDAAGALTIDFDQRSPLADFLVPALLSVPLDGPDDGAARDAQALLEGWDGRESANSAAAAEFNAVWRHLLTLTFGDELAGLPPEAQPNGGDRWIELVRRLVADPSNAWWDDVTTPAVREDRDTILADALRDAADELRGSLGSNPGSWQWGRLHTLELRNASFGESGIGPIEWLFNRGPLELGGGTEIVDATSWSAADGYEVQLAPSMRMVVDLSDLDASRWINLTGASGHAFDGHYDDQSKLWARGETIAWPYGADAVAAATREVLTLQPRS